MPATKEYWPLVLENLKGKISSSNYRAWFSRLQFVSTANHGRKLVLGVPSTFNRNYIESKFKNELKEAISKYYPQVIHVDYQIQKSESQTEEETVQQILNSIEEKPEEAQPTQTAKIKKVSQVQNELSYMNEASDKENSLPSYLPKKTLNNLNPKYTFENFVVTSNSELAVSVCRSVIDEPGTLYNPVFLYGGVGMGKTHLIQAVGQKMLEKNPSFNIKYIPSETFLNQFLLAVQKRRTDEFREYYRSVDLLLIDDVQFFAGKEGTQEAFFHTFNELHQQNKQIILTSDRMPKALGGMEERLVSRFEWGMVADISKPDLEARLAILKDKVERLHLNIEAEQMQKIATKVDSNIRELEGVLNKIQAKFKLLPGKKSLDDDELNKILAQYSNSNSENEINIATTNPDRILQAICKLFSISKSDVLGSSREKNIALARQLTMWFYKTELDLSYPSIGKYFGNRDHTTVMHGYNKIEKIRKEDKKIADKISLVKEILTQN